MRILLVVPEMPPETVGGGGLVFDQLAKGFASEHDVLVLSARGFSSTPAPPGTTRSVLDQAPRRVEVLSGRLARNRPDLPFLRSTLPLTRLAARQRRAAIDTWRPTVAHLHGCGYLSVDETAHGLRRRGIPYVLTGHGLPASHARHGPLGRAAYFAYERSCLRPTVHGAAAVTAISHACADIPGSSDVAVIPNGFTPLPAPTERDRAWASRLRGALPPGPLVLAAGRLAADKGFERLIAALGVAGEPRSLVLAGADAGAGPDLRAQVRALGLERSVALPGAASRAQLAALAEMADLAVVPSRDEPFGLIALELLGAGVRTLVSDSGGLREMFDPAPGWRVPMDEPHTLRSAMEEQLARGALSDEEREQQREITGNHSWRQVVSDYLEVLTGVKT